MSKNLSFTVEDSERDFVDKIAAFYGLPRCEVLKAFYMAGRRTFVAKVKARALIRKLKARYENSPRIDQ